MAEKKKENRGGKREGSGRKRLVLADKQIKKLMSAFRAKAKEHNTSVELEFAGAVLDGELKTKRPATWARLVRIYFDLTVVKQSHQTGDVNVNHKAPVIGLPPVMEKPPEAIKKEEELRKAREGTLH